MGFPSFLGDLTDELEYLDPNDTLKRWLLEAKFGTDPVGTYKLLRDKGISAYTDVLAAPKRAVDIAASRSPINPFGDLDQPIQPIEELLKNALLPKDEGLSGIKAPLPGGLSVDLGEALPDKIEKPATGLVRGAIGTAGRFGLDPTMYGLALPGALGKGAGIYFGAQGAQAGGENLGRAWSEIEGGDIGSGLEHGIEGLGDITVGGLALRHGLGDIKAPLGERLPETFSKDIVWEAPTRETGFTGVDFDPPKLPSPIKVGPIEDRILRGGKLTPEEIARADSDPLFRGVDERVNASQDQFLKDSKSTENAIRGEIEAFRTPEDIRDIEIRSLESQDVPQFNSPESQYLELKPILKDILAPESSLPGGSEAGVINLGEGKSGKLSEQADLLHRLLKGSKQTKLNVTALDRTFQEMGIPLSEGMKADLPGLLRELADKGYAKTHPGGTYTILSGAGRGLKVEAPKAGPSDLEAQLQATLNTVKGTVKPSRPIQSEVVVPERQSGELGDIEEIGVRPRRQKVDTALRDQVNLIEDITSAQDKEILIKDTTGSDSLKARAKEIDKIEKAQAIEENANRRKELANQAKQLKIEQMSEMNLLREQQRLEKAQTKEKLTKKSFEILLSDGSRHVIKARSELSAREFAEKKLSGSKLTVKEVAPRMTSIERVAKGEPLQSESKPSERSLFDDLTDLPKTLKSSFDISFPARQGLFLLNRSEARAGMTRSLKSGLKEKYHLDVQEDLATRPNSQLYKDSGLNQVKYDPTEVGEISEQHPSQLAQKLPGLKQSERMFTDAGNLTRANVFDALTEKWAKQGKTFENRPDLYKGTAKYLNVLTGRDPLPKKLQQAGYILNKAFWSPQFIKSRLQILNPWFYYRLPREVQLEALRDVGGTLGTLTVLLGAVKYAAKASGEDDVEVITDPTHTDFGKIRVGKTKYDFFAGLLPIVRTASRIASSRKTTSSGSYNLPGGFSALDPSLKKAPFGGTAFGELGGFAESKTSPLYQVGKNVLRNKDYYGEPYELPDFFNDLAGPIGPMDIITAWRDYDAEEGLKALPTLVGVGVQTEHVRRDENGTPTNRSNSRRRRRGQRRGFSF